MSAPSATVSVPNYALTNTYFCARHGMPVEVRTCDLLLHLPSLKPYPGACDRDCYQAIYAVTHLIYVLNDYGHLRISPELLPDEFLFLKTAMTWALDSNEPDTVGEVLDSLAACGLRDDDPVLIQGRTFLLDTQDRTGGWGDTPGDPYAAFHTLWTAIDGLRVHEWHGAAVVDYQTRRLLSASPPEAADCTPRAARVAARDASLRTGRPWHLATGRSLATVRPRSV